MPESIAERVKKERKAQGLPAHVRDGATLRKIAALVKGGGGA